MIKEQGTLLEALQSTDGMIEIIDFLLENQVIPQSGAIIEDLQKNIDNLDLLGTKVQEELPNIKFESTIGNIRYVLNKSIARKDFKILEFNVIPLLEELRYMLYYWGAVYPEREKIDYFLENEVGTYCGNLYVNHAEETGNFKYDLSISVLAYNNLKYTKMCVESILSTVPENISYELILINHGSTDGTQEYFESIKPNKIFELHNNNGNYSAVSRIIEGEYHIMFSNDVIALPNAIENMLRLAKEDSKVAFIVPSTPNVSNLQTISACYENYSEMIEFAKKNNVYDPYRHEVRTRLCNPLTLSPSKYAVSCRNGIFPARYQYSADFTSFGDDRISLIYRRHGLKCILQKDAYCHHFGSVTIKNEKALKEEADYYQRGRVEFEKLFGIDPWGTGCCWEPDLFSILPCDKNEKTNILGINCGIGSNSLKVRENLKELQQNLDVELINITDDSRYELDLKGISDSGRIVSSEAELMEICHEKSFDYVIWEDEFKDDICSEQFIEKLIQSMKPKGYIAIKDVNRKHIDILAKKFKYEKAGQWYVFCS
ncbi:MAG: glycosyltransferase [Anaerovoracaceae bacterium]